MRVNNLFPSFFSNFIATIFMCLNLNSIMSVIFNVPAAIASTVRSLISSIISRLTTISAIRLSHVVQSVACLTGLAPELRSSTYILPLGTYIFTDRYHWSSAPAAPTQSFSRAGATVVSNRTKAENPGVHIEVSLTTSVHGCTPDLALLIRLRP